ncbi:MAG: hypothetical protein U0872_04605 [Planctomycetaceae bacterium]
MQRLFVGNFDFEHELADSCYQPSAKLMRLNAELATSWMAVADDGDYLWCSERIEPEFFDSLAAQRLPRVIPITRWNDISAPVELVPWGWTERLSAWARIGNCPKSVPPPQLVRELNSRKFSHELEMEWKCNLPGASAVTDLDQLDAVLEHARGVSSRIVIKANWGMSARERILFSGTLTEAARSWVGKRLAQQGVVFVEPWVERIDEVGVQVQIPQIGSPELLGVTRLVCNEAGQYQGSWFTNPRGKADDFQTRWRPAVEIALHAAERMQQRGYSGPLGIDALRYRLPDGSIRLRPLQDINARWTMGRLSLGWKRFLSAETSGFWRHFTSQDSGAGRFAGLIPERQIEISPAQIGEQPVEHRSVVVFGSFAPDH